MIIRGVDRPISQSLGYCPLKSSHVREEQPKAVHNGDHRVAYVVCSDHSDTLPKVPPFAGKVRHLGTSGRSFTLGIMEGTDLTGPAWVDRVCCVPRDFWGDKTIIGLFREASPDLSDRQRFIELVSGYLDRHEELLETWQTYSYDKRSSPSPYLDGTEVGFFSGERTNVRRYEKSLDACADFIYREASWVLERRVRD